MHYRTTQAHGDVGRGKLIPPAKGKRYSIGTGAVLDLTGNITIGEETEIADGVRIFTHKHHWNSSKDWRKNIQKTVPVTKVDLVIGDAVFIGTNAQLIGISSVGDGAVIGAGAVVTKDVPPYAVVVGNPAKIIKYRGE
jgi:acetyltransferase-like isoleucine patch superfamily enzyme